MLEDFIYNGKPGGKCLFQLKIAPANACYTMGKLCFPITLTGELNALR